MKRFIHSAYFLTLLAISFVLLPGYVQALNFGTTSTLKNAAGKAGYGAVTETSFAETIGSVIQMALSFVGVIFIGLTVYAGFMWMTARGDEGKIDKSKDTLKASIIGLIITLGAYSIAAFVVPAVLEKTTSSACTDDLKAKYEAIKGVDPSELNPEGLEAYNNCS